MNPIKSPKLSIFVSVLLIICCFIGFKIPKSDFSIYGWLDKTDQRIIDLEFFEKTFGNDDVVIVFVTNKSGIFEKKILKKIEGLQENLELTENISQVNSIFNYQNMYAEADNIIIQDFLEEYEGKSKEEIDELKKIAINNKEIKDRLISSDGKTTALYLNLKPFWGENINYTNVYKPIEKVTNAFIKSNSGFEVNIVGETAIQHFNFATGLKDLGIIVPALFSIIFGILWFLFRDIQGLILPNVVILSTLAASTGIFSLLNLTANSFTEIAMPVLMCISIADAIHLLGKVRLYENQGHSKEDAIDMSYKNNFRPTLITSLTTAVGFASLGVSSLVSIREMGIVIAIGSILAWIFTMYLMVPIIKLSKSKRHKHSKNIDSLMIFKNVVPALKKHSGKIFICFTFSVIISLLASFTIDVNFNPYGAFKEDHPLTKSNRVAQDIFGGVVGPQIVVDTGVKDGAKNPVFLKKVDELSEWLKSQKEINHVNSVLYNIKRINELAHGESREYFKIPDDQNLVAQYLLLYEISSGTDLRSLIDNSFQKIRLDTLWNIQDSKSSLEKVKEIKSYADKLGLKLAFTGKTYIMNTLNEQITTTFMSSLSMSFLLITLILMISFKSISLGLMSLIPNVTPLLIGGGLIKLFDLSFDPSLSVVMSISLGIVVDDTIHFIANFQKNKNKNLGLVQNIENVLAQTAPALIITTIILGLGFGSFVLGEFVPNQTVGLFTALILVIALLIDLLILPVVIFLLDRFKSSN